MNREAVERRLIKNIPPWKRTADNPVCLKNISSRPGYCQPPYPTIRS
jgi:hypothetical protein